MSEKRVIYCVVREILNCCDYNHTAIITHNLEEAMIVASIACNPFNWKATNNNLVKTYLEDDEMLIVGEWRNSIRKDRIVKIVEWNINNHLTKFNSYHRNVVKTIISLWKNRESTLYYFPKDMIFYIIELLDSSSKKIDITDKYKN